MYVLLVLNDIVDLSCLLMKCSIVYLLFSMIGCILMLLL